MWSLWEREDGTWVYQGQQPILELHPERDSMIIRPARDMPPEAQSKYLQGILDGMAKQVRDDMPEAEASGQGVMFR